MYYWVERTNNLEPFLGPYKTKEEALMSGTSYIRGKYLTPEHWEIFLIHVEDNIKSDVVKNEKGEVISFRVLANA